MTAEARLISFENQGWSSKTEPRLKESGQDVVSGWSDQSVEIAMNEHTDGLSHLEFSRLLTPSVFADHRTVSVNVACQVFCISEKVSVLLLRSSDRQRVQRRLVPAEDSRFIQLFALSGVLPEW